MTMPTPSINETKLPVVRLAMCQVKTDRWAVEQNFKNALAALSRAGEDKADIAVTPECVLHGYPPHEREKFEALAEPLDGSYIQQVRELAKRYEMNVVFGFLEKSQTENLFYNSCVWIRGDGTTAAIYRKIHCRPFEDINFDGLYTPGKAFHTVEFEVEKTPYKAGMYICFDREIPESTRCLRAIGSELIVCPLATDTSNMSENCSRVDNEILTRSRAAENELFIAVVNHSGVYNGGSFVVGPSGEVLCQLGAEPETRIVELPLGAVREKFHSDPLGWAGWGYRRPEIYDAYLNK